MLNEFTSYTNNIDSTKNDITRRTGNRSYCPNGADIVRPVGTSLPIPPSTSWNYPYFSNFYNYYNPNSYELNNTHQYDNQKCGAQFSHNYNEHPNRFHSTSVLQCCDPRCQLIASHPKYPYHPLNTKLNYRGKRTKNYYGNILDLPKPNAIVPTSIASEHDKYTSYVPYSTIRTDLNNKCKNQVGEYCNPFSNSIKHRDPSNFNEYFTNIGDSSYWNKNNSNIWNRSSATSYYPNSYEEKSDQRIEQGNLATSNNRGILFNRLLEHRNRSYDTNYAPNYYYNSKNDSNEQPYLEHNSVINDNHIPLQANCYQSTPTYNLPYTTYQQVPHYKENLSKNLQNSNNETRIIDKNPTLDVREFLSTWEDDMEDEKLVDGSNENPIIVLDCSNLESDVLAKVKEKLNENVTDDTATILKIVDVADHSVISPHTSVIQENASQSKEGKDKISSESSHINSNSYPIWPNNEKEKDDLPHNLVEMTERLVNTVGKLLHDPEKKIKPPSSLNNSYIEPISSHQNDKSGSNNWNVDLINKNSKDISLLTANSHVDTFIKTDTFHTFINSDKNVQPSNEKNVSCTFNLQKTNSDLKFSMNYSTQQNQYNAHKIYETHPKLKTSEYSQSQYNTEKTQTSDISNTDDFCKNYSAYFENTSSNYEHLKGCNTNPQIEPIDGTLNYMEHIDKHLANDRDITLVKADLEKSLNEITHCYNQDDGRKNNQHSSDHNINQISKIEKCEVNVTTNNENKGTESQLYNGVIQKTGICNSLVHKLDDTFTNENNLLSMPSLSPPPTPPMQLIVPLSPISKNYKTPLDGANLTLNDVYENEVIFNSTSDSTSDSILPFTVDNQEFGEQIYQPLNLALRGNVKSPILNQKDSIKSNTEYDLDKKIDNINIKADDGYYSIENIETDDVHLKNIEKQSSNITVPTAHKTCIVSNKYFPDQPEIEKISSHSSEVESKSQLSDQNDSNCNETYQLLTKYDNNITDKKVNDNLKKQILDEQIKESIPSLLNPLNPIDKIQPNNANVNLFENANFAPNDFEIMIEKSSDSIKIFDNDKKIEFHSDLKEEKHISVKSDNAITQLNQILQVNNESNLEETALNLKIGPNSSDSSVFNNSIIKENETTDNLSKENEINSIILEDNLNSNVYSNEILNSMIKCDTEIISQKSIIKSSINEKIEEIRSFSSKFEQDVTEKSLKHRLSYTVKDNNLPMKKRKSQEYLSREKNCISSQSANVTFDEKVVEDFTNTLDINFINFNKYYNKSQLKKNKKKHKREKLKSNLEDKKYLKFKKEVVSHKFNSFSNNLSDHLSLCEQEEILCPLSPKNNEKVKVSSPIYEDDLFNIPSVAPTPQCDLNRDDFEFSKLQISQKSLVMNDNISSSMKLKTDENGETEFNNFTTDQQFCKAPSPHCFLQDESYNNEELSSKAPSPICNIVCEIMSPNSVAPSPNYDIIEGVLFDDTDWSASNDSKYISDQKKESLNSMQCLNYHLELTSIKESSKFENNDGKSESDYDIHHVKSKLNNYSSNTLTNYHKYKYHLNKNLEKCMNTKYSQKNLKYLKYNNSEKCIRKCADKKHKLRPKFTKYYHKSFKNLNEITTTKICDNVLKKMSKSNDHLDEISKSHSDFNFASTLNNYSYKDFIVSPSNHQFGITLNNNNKDDRNFDNKNESISDDNVPFVIKNSSITENEVSEEKNFNSSISSLEKFDTEHISDLNDNDEKSNSSENNIDSFSPLSKSNEEETKLSKANINPYDSNKNIKRKFQSNLCRRNSVNSLEYKFNDIKHTSSPQNLPDKEETHFSKNEIHNMKISNNYPIFHPDIEKDVDISNEIECSINNNKQSSINKKESSDYLLSADQPEKINDENKKEITPKENYVNIKSTVYKIQSNIEQNILPDVNKIDINFNNHSSFNEFNNLKDNLINETKSHFLEGGKDVDNCKTRLILDNSIVKHVNLSNIKESEIHCNENVLNFIEDEKHIEFSTINDKGGNDNKNESTDILNNENIISKNIEEGNIIQHEKSAQLNFNNVYINLKSNDRDVNDTQDQIDMYKKSVINNSNDNNGQNNIQTSLHEEINDMGIISSQFKNKNNQNQSKLNENNNDTVSSCLNEEMRITDCIKLNTVVKAEENQLFDSNFTFCENTNKNFKCTDTSMDNSYNEKLININSNVDLLNHNKDQIQFEDNQKSMNSSVFDTHGNTNIQHELLNQKISNLSEIKKSEISNYQHILLSNKINTDETFCSDENIIQSQHVSSIIEPNCNIPALPVIFDHSHESIINEVDSKDTKFKKLNNSAGRQNLNGIDNTCVNVNDQSINNYCYYSDLFKPVSTNSDEAVHVDKLQPVASCVVNSTNIIEKNTSGIISDNINNCYDVPTLRNLAIQALSNVNTNYNILEVRDTPEHTEIIIRSDGQETSDILCDEGNSNDLIMREVDDETPYSSNFDSMKELTFEYPILPECTNNKEKNDEDLPCQCLVINSEESILCLRCSLNSSIIVNRFSEIDGVCESSEGYDFVAANCIEESFVDQEIDFSSSLMTVDTPAATTSDSCLSSCSVFEKRCGNVYSQQPQIKVQLPWHKIFNLTDGSNNVDCNDEQRILELGPAQIEVRMSSEENGLWKKVNVSGSSSPVLKVKRLVVQRATPEKSRAVECEQISAELECRKQIKKRRSLLSGIEPLGEIFGVPKMVIKKTSFRRYESFLCTNSILQPVVRLIKNKHLDKLAMKYHDGDASIKADDVKQIVEIDQGLGQKVPESLQKVEIDNIVNNLTDEEKNCIADSTVDEYNGLMDKSNGELLPVLGGCRNVNDFLNETKLNYISKPERHHCMLCHRSYSSLGPYKSHLKERFHRYLELMQRKTIHAVFRRFTGRVCPRLKPLTARERKKMRWKPRNANVNHFYHQRTPLQIALQKSVFHDRKKRR